MRKGFTLIETLVALVLFQLGMLVLVGLSVVAARDLASAKLNARAHDVARNRVEALRVGACTSTVAGVAQLYPGLAESWRVAAIGAHRRVTDSVEYLLPRGRRRSVVYASWVVCSP